MSPFLKDASVEAVLTASDIVDVVSAYTTLRQRGSTYTGLCPFHQEKTPSFSVSADKGVYYCFGCGEGGGVLTFIQRMENLSFVEAVESLADRFHVALEYEEGGRSDSGGRTKEKRLFAVLEKAAIFYERYLWEAGAGTSARTYLEGRGLDDAAVREFRVGLAPAEWRGLHRRAVKEGFTEAELEAAGLLVLQPGKAYDRFRGRLMFPLVDHRGRVVGFGGRTLADEMPKYVNSPEGALYQKSRLLYGLHQGRKAIAEADEILVVEGYTDVIALAQAGVRNVVASMGTSLTEGQVQLMKRFTGNVTFMYDGDRAGVDAIIRSGDLVRRHDLHPRVVDLPEGRDPADVAKQAGADEVRRLVAARVPLLTFEIHRILDQADTSSPEGRVHAFEEVRRVLDRSASPKEREEELRTIADRLRLSPDIMTVLLNDVPSRRSGRPDSPSRRGALSAETLLSGSLRVEREFLIAVVAQPVPGKRLLATLDSGYFEDVLHREAFLGLQEALAGTDPGAVLRRRSQEGSDLGSLFVKLAVQAENGPYSEAVLEELCLRVQEQYLARSVRGLKMKLEVDDTDKVTERQLRDAALLLNDVRKSLSNLDEG